MATTKTLTPTNQAITLAAFTEKPDNRTNVTNDDKMADAINTLNSNYKYVSVQSSDDLETKLASAFTTLSNSGLKENISYPIMLYFGGSGGFAGALTGTCNVTSGGIRFLLADESHMLHGLFLRSNNTISALTDLASTYGTVNETISWVKSGNCITVYINGTNVQASSSWATLAELPAGFGTRYTYHLRSMDGTELQLSGTTIKYRNASQSSIFGAFTYVKQ